MIERPQSMLANMPKDLGSGVGASESSDSESQVTASEADSLPEHDETHAGPYGVEMPPNFSFIVTVNEFIASEHNDDLAGSEKGKSEK